MSIPVQLFPILVLLVFLAGWFLSVYVLSKIAKSLLQSEGVVNGIALAGVVISATWTLLFYQYFQQFVV